MKSLRKIRVEIYISDRLTYLKSLPMELNWSDLNHHKAVELRQACRERNIKLTGLTKKSQYIEKLGEYKSRLDQEAGRTENCFKKSSQCSFIGDLPPIPDLSCFINEPTTSSKSPNTSLNLWSTDYVYNNVECNSLKINTEAKSELLSNKVGTKKQSYNIYASPSRSLKTVIGVLPKPELSFEESKVSTFGKAPPTPFKALIKNMISPKQSLSQEVCFTPQEKALEQSQMLRRIFSPRSFSPKKDNVAYCKATHVVNFYQSPIKCSKGVYVREPIINVSRRNDFSSSCDSYPKPILIEGTFPKEKTEKKVCFMNIDQYSRYRRGYYRRQSFTEMPGAFILIFSCFLPMLLLCFL